MHGPAPIPPLPSHRWWHTIAAIARAALAPATCCACDDRLSATAVFCPSCCLSLLPVPAGYERVFGAYGGALAQAIARFKYGNRPDLARPLTSLLVRACATASPPDAVVPVPLHPRRLRWRGYNQSALLAQGLAHGLNVPCRHLLQRCQHGPTQAACPSPHERWEQVKEAFAVRPGAPLQGARIWLVDDVRTTGATATACSRVLLSQGAAQVQLVVLASAGSRTFW